MKKLYVIFSLSIVLGLAIFIAFVFLKSLASAVGASPRVEKKAYCHATSSEIHPYNYLFNRAWVQHFRNNGTPKAGHELDFFTLEGDRDCDREVDVEPTPTPIIDECDQDDDCISPIPTASPSATPTPEVTEAPRGETLAEQCSSVAPVLLPANPLVWRRGGDAIVQWIPTEGNKAHVYYYENQNPGNAHAVRDTENDGYVEIGYLGSLDWTFGVQQAQECAGGQIVWIVDG